MTKRKSVQNFVNYINKLNKNFNDPNYKILRDQIEKDLALVCKEYGYGTAAITDKNGVIYAEALHINYGYDISGLEMIVLKDFFLLCINYLIP